MRFNLIGGSCRVTLVVAFGFLLQNFGRWWSPKNGTLSFYECMSVGCVVQTLTDGRDTQTLPAVINSFERFALTDAGYMLKRCP